MVNVNIFNPATKPSSLDYDLVARLSILTNMQQELDLSSEKSVTILCPIKGGHNSLGIDKLVKSLLVIQTTTLSSSAYNFSVMT